MSIEHIRAASREGIMSLYQLDPGFYRMIISRNPSLGRSPTVRSVYHSATNGKVPFHWETEPGEPKLGATTGTKTTPPINLPPGARGFAIPNPTSRPTKKGMKTKKGRIHIRIPRLVKQIGRIGPLVRRGSTNKNKKKSPSFHDRSDDDDEEDEDDDLTRSSSRGISKSSWSFLSSSSSYSNAHKFSDKSGKLLLKVLRLPGQIFKWKTKSTTNLTS